METAAALQWTWTVLALLDLLVCERLGRSKQLDIRSAGNAELRLIGFRTLRTYLGIAGVFALFALSGFRALSQPPSSSMADPWVLALGASSIGLEVYLTGLVLWLDWTATRIRRFSLPHVDGE